MPTKSTNTDQTPSQRLASLILGQPVRVWISSRRDAGRSWRLVARDLYEATNGQIDVTHETVRAWSEQQAA
jgi:hypothetical protein